MTKSDSFEMELVEKARLFAEAHVAPNSAAWERERRIGMEALKEAAKLGLASIQVPVASGGLGQSFACKVEVLMALAREDFGFAMSLVNTHNVAHKLSETAPARVAAKYVGPLINAVLLGCTALTEPSAGSDVGAVATTARRIGGEWELCGEKTWITNGSLADVVIVYAQTEPGAGTKGIAAFLVDARRPGFERLPPMDMAGQHSIGAGGFKLKGYLAGDDELLSPPGRAFKEVMEDINGARTYVAAMCCAMVEKAVEICSGYGRVRGTFGKPLTCRQGWRWNIAMAETDLAAARLLVERATDLIVEGGESRLLSAQAKIFATMMAERQLPRLIQAMGAEGLREKYPLMRHLTGARVAGYVDGSTEMLLERVSSHLVQTGENSKI